MVSQGTLIKQSTLGRGYCNSPVLPELSDAPASSYIHQNHHIHLNFWVSSHTSYNSLTKAFERLETNITSWQMQLRATQTRNKGSHLVTKKWKWNVINKVYFLRTVNDNPLPRHHDTWNNHCLEWPAQLGQSHWRKDHFNIYLDQISVVQQARKAREMR